ncbi:IL-1 receptor antagonist [Eptesipox virus]|uniref:IL-1 receptor antagonist n=1 Tax=Eptesipox virus TaxID=1329402 RepID=A0A220T6L7_9POXV|nr:IL-1 receptor antagonist [Eptesipox virus]ASK51359.1 IL-1 receptor antagonist [Eptesipox virus]
MTTIIENNSFDKDIFIFNNSFNDIKIKLSKLDSSTFKQVNNIKYIIKNNKYTNYIFTFIKTTLENTLTFVDEVIIDNYITLNYLNYLDDINYTPFASNFTIYKPYRLILNLDNETIYKKITSINYYNTIIKTNNDCIVNKSVKTIHKNKNNYIRKLIFINVLIKLKSNKIYSTLYNNNNINFYSTEEKNQLICYCKIYTDNPHVIVDNFGCFVYKDGSCCLINRYNKLVKKIVIVPNFKEMCFNLFFNYNNNYYLSNDDNKNIAWTSLEKNINKWIPNITISEDKLFLQYIIDNVNKNNIDYYILTCRYYDEVNDIILKVNKFFFNVLKKSK